MQSSPDKPLQDFLLLKNRMVESKRKAREEGIEIEVFRPIASIANPRTMALLEIEYYVVSVTYQVLAKQRGDAVGVYSVFHRHGWSPATFFSSEA